jgi:hypothetical protein
VSIQFTTKDLNITLMHDFLDTKLHRIKMFLSSIRLMHYSVLDIRYDHIGTKAIKKSKQKCSLWWNGMMSEIKLELRYCYGQSGIN